MRQTEIDKLRTWSVGSRVRITDELGQESPLLATVLFIADCRRGFLLKYDHNGTTKWLSVTDIHHFDLHPAAA